MILVEIIFILLVLPCVAVIFVFLGYGVLAGITAIYLYFFGLFFRPARVAARRIVDAGPFYLAELIFEDLR
jgi:membrane-bound ClpP family serine protease